MITTHVLNEVVQNGLLLHLTKSTQLRHPYCVYVKWALYDPPYMWKIECSWWGVGSKNVTNVTTLGVVISLRQMSQPQSQHQQQMVYNNKRRRGFSSKNDKRQNVTK